MGERRFSAGDPVSGSRRGTPDFIKSQKMRAGLSSGGGPGILGICGFPFLTPPFDAGGRRGQENEAAEETEFLKGFSGRQLSKKDGGPGRQQKKGDSWRNIRRRWERFMGGFPWQWK